MKPYIVFQGPIENRSGYGDHARDLIKALIKSNKYDIDIISTRWGDCPMDALSDNKNLTETEVAMKGCILNSPQLPKQPDVFIQITVPNEFSPIGKANIGITAGIETDICDASWIEGCNRMDLIIVPSQHSAQVFHNTTYDKIDEKTKKKISELKLAKSIVVLFEGVDTDIFNKEAEVPKTIKEQLDNIEEEFCFLYVGHWLKGKMGHDRKDTGMLIQTFCNAFKHKHKQPALILKTSGAGFGISERDEFIQRVEGIRNSIGGRVPNVYFLHGDLEPGELNGLYNHKKVKAMVSFTKGEGFGRPLLEFSTSAKPVIASNWSGQTDFLHPDYSILLPGELKEVHKSARWKGVINEGSKWFYADYNNASRIMRDVYKSYKEYIPGARKQAHLSKTEFSLNRMNEIFVNIIDDVVKQVPQQVGLQLPDEKSMPKLPKLKTKKKEQINNSAKVTMPQLKRV